MPGAAGFAHPVVKWSRSKASCLRRDGAVSLLMSLAGSLGLVSEDCQRRTSKRKNTRWPTSYFADGSPPKPVGHLAQSVLFAQFSPDEAPFNPYLQSWLAPEQWRHGQRTCASLHVPRFAHQQPEQRQYNGFATIRAYSSRKPSTPP